MAAARASQPDAEPNGLSPSDQVSLRLRAMSTHDPAERDLGATCDDVGGGDVSSDLDVIMGRGGGSGGGSACCARSQTLPQAELALGNASGVAVCKSAQCAVACDGIEQAYLPTPLSDPPMEEEEIDQLRTWLAEAANQLYGRDAGGHADLVDRTAAVLRNSSLTSTVFAAFSAVDGAKTVDDSKPLSDKDSRLDLSALPSSLRSLLDERSLSFLLELWRVLHRDEPNTANALLNPADDSTIPALAGSARGVATDPLATARCDALGEVLGEALKRSFVVAPSAADGVSGWDAQLVTAWIERRVMELQGFRST